MSRLSKMLGMYLRVNDIEYATLADQIGISRSSMTRFLQGKGLEVSAYLKLLVWLSEEEQLNAK